METSDFANRRAWLLAGLLVSSLCAYIVYTDFQDRKVYAGDENTLIKRINLLEKRVESLALGDHVGARVGAYSDTAAPHDTDAGRQDEKLKRLNVFVENHGDNPMSSCDRQFYKTFGSHGSGELFKCAKKLPVYERKRILVTGGAGFVGKFSSVQMFEA